MMKRNIIACTMMGLAMLVTTSCDKYLDINTNPNTFTSTTPSLILPQAITATAALQVSFNTYGGELGGFIANAGGFSGFGALINYAYTTANYTGMFGSVYDNNFDYKYVLEQTAGNDQLSYSNAIARIMTAYNTQKLVDTYGDVPYSEAYKAVEKILNPKYDKAEAIYQDVINQLEAGIKTINDAKFPLGVSASDPLFKGDMNKWKQFANTIKLRMLIHISDVASLNAFVTSKRASFDAAGFLTDDAMVNPGYVKQSGQQNPMWTSYGYSVAGAVAPTSRIPTKWIFGFYKGQKLNDTYRGGVIFKNYALNSGSITPVNQLGNETNSPAILTNYSTWYTGTFTSATDISAALGVMKGPTMGMPIVSAAEAYFLQAEAALKGWNVSGLTAKAAFDAGIVASFNYLYKDISGALATGKTPAADVTAYQAANASSTQNYLANYNLAATDAQRLEAIITQKYIAMNMITMDEAWHEFRRTAYPKIVDGSTDAYQTFASIVSTSTRADKLPTRVLYPTSEYTLNLANVPPATSINQFATRIFWDPN